MEVAHDPTYAPYLITGGGTRSVTAFLGARVALICDEATCVRSLDLARMRSGDLLGATSLVVSLIEQLLGVLDSVIGPTFAPALDAPYRGRIRVEVGEMQGFNGCAHHGRLGFYVDASFLGVMLARAVGGSPTLCHVVGYEALRNYIDPEVFTLALDYRCAAGACPRGGVAHDGRCVPQADSWGWVNQGAVDIVGVLLLDQLIAPGGGGVQLDYHGSDRASFRAEMEADAVRAGAIAAAAISGWGAVWQHDRLPWDASRSLDNAYAGIFSQCYDVCGGPRWLSGLWAALPLLLANGRAPESKDDVRTASENFYIAARVGAGAEGAPEVDRIFAALHWPLREGIAGPEGLAAALGAAAAGE